MSLLLDENLSPRLVIRLLSLFPVLTHVRDVGLKQAADERIWAWAKENGYTVVTADADFVELSNRLGWPPKVVHLERCDFPLLAIEQMFRHYAIRIAEFEGDPATGLLVIRA